MVERASATAFLNGAVVAPDVFGVCPDYRAMLVVAHGLTPSASGQGAEELLRAAEASAAARLATGPVERLPHVAAWRQAYQGFGAKPARTRNSLEALTRRAPTGLPRVNPLTDLYNAVSVLHQVPIGGEDLDRYVGSPRLVRATGEEPFDTAANGQEVIESPEPGEVVWCDDVGVTCRRWNWRQGRRTALREDTTNALFIIDALDPMSDEALHAVAAELSEHLLGLGPDVQVNHRLLRAATTAPLDHPEHP